MCHQTNRLKTNSQVNYITLLKWSCRIILIHILSYFPKLSRIFPYIKSFSYCNLYFGLEERFWIILPFLKFK
uniref:Uncharacterized protein n=1 Tax=Seriola lalandi dorsalis TaxID=1841481 RepID=A0A3B4YYS9_SERLL